MEHPVPGRYGVGQRLDLPERRDAALAATGDASTTDQVRVAHEELVGDGGVEDGAQKGLGLPRRRGRNVSQHGGMRR